MSPTLFSYVAKTNQEIGKLALETNSSRESLYRTLSEEGNPYFTTIDKILGSFGMRLAVMKKTQAFNEGHSSTREE